MAMNMFFIYLLNVSRFPCLVALNLEFSYTKWPFNMVWVTLDLKAVPSKGDQPHLYNMFCLFTVQGLFRFTITKSAKYPSFIKPLFSIWNRMAGLWHIFSTNFSMEILPLWWASNMATKACWTKGPPEGALVYTCFFSSRVCGAWSVARTSILPSKKAFHSSSLSFEVLTAGFHFINVPLVS